MRLKSISARNILPVKEFVVDDLSDVVVIAGPNGVGKTRLIEGFLSYFQSLNSSTIRFVVEATCQSERLEWGQNLLDTGNSADAQKLVRTLQSNRRRANWQSSVLNFESDR